MGERGGGGGADRGIHICVCVSLCGERMDMFAGIRKAFGLHTCVYHSPPSLPPSHSGDELLMLVLPKEHDDLQFVSFFILATHVYKSMGSFTLPNSSHSLGYETVMCMLLVHMRASS